MPISASNYDGTSNYNVAEMGDLAKANLLINADFESGIINQKDVKTGSNLNGRLTMHEDMWLLMGINCYSQVKTTSIIFGAKENKTFVVQNIDALQAGKYHCYVNVKGLTGTAKVYLQKRPSGYATELHTLTNGENKFVINVTDATDSFQISLEPNSNVEISQMKLEPGEYFTGMPAWDKEEQLSLCQRYWYSFPVSMTQFNVLANNAYIYTLPIQKMADKPSAKISPYDRYNIKSATVTVIDNGGVYLTITPNTTSFRIGARIEIDANNY